MGKSRNVSKEIPRGVVRVGGFGRKNRGTVVKPKNFKGTILRLWEYFEGEEKWLLIVLFFIVVTSVIGLVVPYLFGKSIDAISQKNGIVDFFMLATISIILIFIYIIDGIMSFFQNWILAGIAQRIVKKLRTSFFNKLQKLPIEFFDLRSNGEVMSRLSNDIENVSSTISQSTVQLMSGTIVILGSFIMMLSLSFILTLASIITVPLVFLVSKNIAKKTKVLFKSQQVELGKLNGYIEEAISGIFIVKAFNHENKVIKEFDEVNSKLCEVGRKAQVWSGFIMPLMNVINNLGFTVVAGVGGVLAVKEIITIGIIASFLSYSRQFTRPLNNLANIFNNLQSAVAGAERVFEILDNKEEVEDKLDAKRLNKVNGEVIFENVSFEYQRGTKILKNIDFYAEAGTTIALVGPTGAGKTTIVNLLARFYDVSHGRILIDGIDIREYTRDSLRKCFGIVLQDTYLFSNTIRENIRYGRLDASDEEVELAASMANADIFIKRMPKGYDTLLSESGSNLSHGQKQLIAISRAILSNPSILILDEATSSVDTRTEIQIQEAMLKLMKGRTSFIIAHRLSTIKDADTIIVIDNGEIAEIGNHSNLIKNKGIYYNMCST